MMTEAELLEAVDAHPHITATYLLCRELKVHPFSLLKSLGHSAAYKQMLVTFKARREAHKNAWWEYYQERQKTGDWPGYAPAAEALGVETHNLTRYIKQRKKAEGIKP
jgi:hypothetical protein